jgi:hypothetical protein
MSRFPVRILCLWCSLDVVPCMLQTSCNLLDCVLIPLFLGLSRAIRLQAMSVSRRSMGLTGSWTGTIALGEWVQVLRLI